jgi:dolichol-phosphate mannosyltransferase
MPKPQTLLLAICIPMYNEAVDAAACIVEVMKYIGTIPAIQLIIINDGSSDSTLSILEAQQKKFHGKFTIISHQTNRGYGAAIQTGVHSAAKVGAEYVLFMDADLTNHPRFLKNFVAKIPDGYDCVKASRYIHGGGMVGVPLYRQLFSTYGNKLVNLCFRMHLHDYTNGFRMLRVAAAKKIMYTKNDFSLLLEEMYYLKKMNARCCEIPHVLTNRVASSSHFVYSFKLFQNYLYFMSLALRV